MWGYGRWYDPWFNPFSDELDSEDETDPDNDASSGPSAVPFAQPRHEEWNDHADVEPFTDREHCRCPSLSGALNSHEEVLSSDDEEILTRPVGDCDLSGDQDILPSSSRRADSDNADPPRKYKVNPCGRVITKMTEAVPKAALGSENLDFTSFDIPEELVIQILAKLPFRSFFRLRTVCKMWNSLIYDPRFAKMCSRRDSAELPFCMIFDHLVQGYSTFDPASHVWRRLPRSFFSFSAGKFCLLASAGGLLLFEGIDFDERTLFVVNPINKSERRLPKMVGSSSNDKVYYAQMAMDKNTDDFKALIVDAVEDLFSLKFQVYDSKTNSWEMSGVVPDNLGDADFRGVVLHQGSLYCLAHVPYSYEVYRIELLEGGSNKSSQNGMDFWQVTNIKVPDKEFLFLDLFEHAGHLMVIGRTDDVHHELNLRFWCLKSVEVKDKASELKWVEVQRLPEKLRESFSGLEDFALVLAQGDYIWASTLVENYRKHRTVIEGSIMVMSNIVQKTWCVVPRYPFGCPSHCNREFCGDDWGRRSCTLFLFEPRLDLRITLPNTSSAR